MEERKHPLLSRKFWVAIITAVTMFVSYQFGLELDVEAIIVILLPIIAWIAGESYIDAAHK